MPARAGVVSLMRIARLSSLLQIGTFLLGLTGPATFAQQVVGRQQVVAEAVSYRPQTESYGAPFQRRRVEDLLEVVPGAGIRINGDDDDGDQILDRDDPFVPGENDLIEVELRINPAAPSVTYHLVRSSPALKVFSESTKGMALLDTLDEVQLAFVGESLTVWIECPAGGAADLGFEARTSSGARVVARDVLGFQPFTSIVIALDGEFQTPTDPPSSINGGIAEMAIGLYQAGYDVHMYDEDVVASDGTGAAYDEVVSAIQRRGVSSVAVYGFSHGGGSTYDLCRRLDDNSIFIGAFDIVYTAYIDGIENDGTFDLDSETRLPPSTAYHVNYYQRNIFSGLTMGNSVPGADVDVNVTQQSWGGGILHANITLAPEVQAGLMDPLYLLVSP